VSVNVGTAYLEIVPSARGFAGKLQGQVGSSVAGVGKTAGDKAGKSFGSAFGGRVKSIIGATAGLALGAAAVGLLKGSIAEAREAQRVGALTTQVIKTTGGAAHVTAQQVGELSTAISNKTGIDDEQIQSGVNMLLTFKNIRNEVGKNNNIFDQTAAITTDMAAAMAAASGSQINLKGTSIQVGRALNDPVKGITALSRAGVQFTDKQKDQIKTLVESGDTLGAQKIILKELKSEFGGTAAATATNGDKMRVAFGNLKEQIGTALLPVIDKIQKALVDKVIPAVSQFFAEMQSGTGTGGQVAAILGTVFDVLGKVFGFLSDHKETVVTFVAVLGAMAIAFGILNAVMAANPISLVIIAIAALVTGLIMAYKHSETFRTIVDAAFRIVAKAIDFAKDHWRLLITLILGPFGAAIVFVVDHFNTVKNVCQTVFRFIVNAFLTVVGALVNGAAKAFGWVPGLGGKLKSAAAAFNNFRDDVNRALDGIHSVKEIHLNVTTRQSVIVSSINKPRSTPGNVDGAGATGAIINRPTVALIGEAGPEALIPLNRTAGNAPLPSSLGGGIEAEQTQYRAFTRALSDSRTVIMSKGNLEDLDLLVGAM
jgi:hypothetical protein